MATSRQLAGRQLERQHAHREDIRADVGAPPGQQLRRDVAQLDLSEPDSAQRLILQRREQVLRLPDPRARDQQALAIVVGGDTHDVGSNPAEQAFSPMQHARGFHQLLDQTLQAGPRHRPGGVHHLAQALSLDEISDEVHEIRFLAIVAHLHDGRMRDLQGLRLAHEACAHAFPVPLCVPSQQPDRDG